VPAGHAIGEILAFGVGVALSPLAVIAVVQMLATPKGTLSAFAFLAGWMLALAVVGTIALAIADGADASENSAPADWVGIAKVLAGCLLLLLAARQWRGRSDQAEPELPAWTTQLATLTPPRAAGLAVLLASVKPKNLLLTVGAALAIAETGASTGGQAVALAVFVLLGALGPGIPLGIHVLMRDRGAEVLGRVREWMIRENSTIIAVLCLVLAAKLIGDAVGTLAS
jgi:hypothetical protein